MIHSESMAAELLAASASAYAAIATNRLIEKLPEKRQIIFKLNRIDGLTYKEIAKKLDISENTVQF